MLQSIMGYRYPPVVRQTDTYQNITFPVVLRTRAVINEEKTLFSDGHLMCYLFWGAAIIKEIFMIAVAFAECDCTLQS